MKDLPANFIFEDLYSTGLLLKRTMLKMANNIRNSKNKTDKKTQNQTNTNSSENLHK